MKVKVIDKMPLQYLTAPLSDYARHINTLFTLLASVIAIFMTVPAFAHGEGGNLDELMGSKEKFFQKTDKPAPPFELANADGEIVQLDQLSDKIIVLNFIYASCEDVCPLHSNLIGEIQERINLTPMKDMVEFISVTTDPLNDTADVLRDYPEIHGLDAANWRFLTVPQDQAEDTTRKLAQSFGHQFKPTDDGAQVHGVITHIIDRKGRWSANFHGLRFNPTNAVLYINGLTNSAHFLKKEAEEKTSEPTLWQEIQSLF